MLTPRGIATHAHIAELVGEPFAGITADGQPLTGLFPLQDNGAPTEAMVDAAQAILSLASPDELSLLRRDIDSVQWRKWANAEYYRFRDTLRLDEHRQPLRDAIWGLLRASMSPAGFAKAVECMRINAFLGELVDGLRVMNVYSYNFCLFGEPSLTRPWGWQYFGHHLCLNCFVVGHAMTISPTFMGAEPNVIDTGPHASTKTFADEERNGLALMQSLSTELQARAQIYELMHDPRMPEGRWVPTDQRHLGGAYQDNRVIPYEGVPATEMTEAQQRLLLDLVGTFVGYLPESAYRARLRQVREHLDQTYFCWIGRYGDDDVFYYRIQSPVVMVEFDHHSGVFLRNTEPERFHVHTIVRTPNGNDYGKDWLAQYRARSPDAH